MAIFGNAVVGQGPKPQFVYPQTDMGNALLFLRLFGKNIHWDEEGGGWIVWAQMRWFKGMLARKELMRLIKKFLNKLYSQAKSPVPLRTRNGEPVSLDAALQHAESSSQRARIMAMLELVKEMPGVRISRLELDRSPYLLGVGNGVVDMTKATLVENDPKELITRYARARYFKTAPAPEFMKFLSDICLGRKDLMDFLQEVVGYTLSGSAKEEAFFLLVGTGANGKSTFVETILYLIGDYGIGMPGNAFIKSNSRAIQNEFARLPGVRMATGSEANPDVSIDEAKVQRGTGADTMTARFIGKEYFDFRSTAKFFLSVNTLPKIIGANNGIFRRFIVIPFDGDFRDSMDRDKPEKLKGEIDGILAWAVEGFMRWHKRGHLEQPACVIEASAAYREEMDTVQTFLNACCTLAPDASTALTTLFDAYQKWGEERLVDTVGKHIFGGLMVQKGFKKKKSGPWSWKGVALKATPLAASTPAVFGRAAVDSQAETTELPQ